MASIMCFPRTVLGLIVNTSAFRGKVTTTSLTTIDAQSVAIMAVGKQVWWPFDTSCLQIWSPGARTRMVDGFQVLEILLRPV